MSVVINPGSGPVDGANEEHAIAAVQKFIEDLGLGDVEALRASEVDEGGRFGFELVKDPYSVLIEMPGLAVDRVRYVAAPTQNIWDFPRLYVDGSSWVWLYALKAASHVLSPEASS